MDDNHGMLLDEKKYPLDGKWKDKLCKLDSEDKLEPWFTRRITHGKYRVRRWFSESVKDLLSKLLCKNCKERITLCPKPAFDQISDPLVLGHPWCQEGLDNKEYAKVQKEKNWLGEKA